jgi:hypothetical protein
MKLETPLLDEFARVRRAVPGFEMWASVSMPDGSTKQFDLVAVFVKPEDNPTGRAALGHPET